MNQYQDKIQIKVIKQKRLLVNKDQKSLIRNYLIY